MNGKRVATLNEGEEISGPVLYWMSRDQRARDNWALLFAQELALERKFPLIVVFCLVPEFLGAGMRQYMFMLKGLRKVEADLAGKNIPFFLLKGRPEEELPGFAKKVKASLIVSDFSPLRIRKKWNKAILEAVGASFYEVDAHNIVPCRIASRKQEYAAYTFRPKVRKAMDEFMDTFHMLKKHPFSLKTKPRKTDWEKAADFIDADQRVGEVDWLSPGEDEAKKVLRDFIKNKLSDYERLRNDPNADGQSNLSPYLHFGQISAQRVALEVRKSGASESTVEAFLEELVVRRELSDNFCFYNDRYDSTEGFPEWSRKSIDRHREDFRRYVYSLKQFEHAETHDDLWNAAQREMIVRGKMHGYMRMYWAKKILEWSASPEDAMHAAIFLNDKYELDGRDPNGYAGIAWSIGGVHDRAWNERPVFGKIRYMSYHGCTTKFNVKRYMEKYPPRAH